MLWYPLILWYHSLMSETRRFHTFTPITFSFHVGAGGWIPTSLGRQGRASSLQGRHSVWGHRVGLEPRPLGCETTGDPRYDPLPARLSVGTRGDGVSSRWGGEDCGQLGKRVEPFFTLIIVVIYKWCTVPCTLIYRITTGWITSDLREESNIIVHIKQK